jgi:2-phosphosulfolactate phosphatase
VNPAHRQSGHGLRHDWGGQGATAVAAGADVAVVVDVLSFTTTLSVAADAGTVVYPYRWADDDTAGRFASEHDATLAVSRSAAQSGQVSLSPASVRNAIPPPARLVLPSPNGSTIAQNLAGCAGAVIGACLRNTDAVAAWISANHRPGTAIAVVSAGERWPDGSLRPCVEDWWGAGALLAALRCRGWDDLSPEAAAAEAAYHGVADHLSEALRACASGKELAAAGHRDDIDIAAEIDTSPCVPLMNAGAFVAARGN